MTNSHYDKLFAPFQRGDHDLESVMKWLKNITKADQLIIDQVIAEAMGKISQGEDFTGKCPCGCDFDEEKFPDAKISHYMLARVFELKKSCESAWSEVLQKHQNAITEARQKQLVNTEKQMLEAQFGTWSQRNIPTFRKWFGFKD